MASCGAGVPPAGLPRINFTNRRLEENRRRDADATNTSPHFSPPRADPRPKKSVLSEIRVVSSGKTLLLGWGRSCHLYAVPAEQTSEFLLNWGAQRFKRS